jgi:hypothetical protein
METGIDFCHTNRLYSINFVKDYLEQAAEPKREQIVAAIPVSHRKYHINTEKRPLEVYARVGGSR